MTNQELIVRALQIAIDYPDEAQVIDDAIKQTRSSNRVARQAAFVLLRVIVDQYDEYRYVYVLRIGVEGGKKGYWLLKHDAPLDSRSGDYDLEIVYNENGLAPLPILFYAGSWEVAYGPASKQDCVEFMEDMAGA